MAFEFVGRQLRDGVYRPITAHRFDDLEDLEGEIGDGRENRPEDVVRVKRALGRLGRLEEPERGFSSLIDRPLDDAIRRFQRENKLRVDGFLRPGGRTQRTLQAQLHRIADGRDEPPRHRVDFDFISELEGGQRLKGYVPRRGDSGVTVGTGVDLGQRSGEEIDRLDLPGSLRDKLRPFAGCDVPKRSNFFAGTRSGSPRKKPTSSIGKCSAIRSTRSSKATTGARDSTSVICPRLCKQ